MGQYYYFPQIRSVRESSSQQIRVKPLSLELQKHGIECTMMREPSELSLINPFQRYLFPYNWNELVMTAKYVKKHDVLFISRISSFVIYFLQWFWKQSGKKTVFDFDDAIFLQAGARFSSLANIIAHSNFVTTSSHYLLSYAKTLNQNSSLIHTPIDCRLFTPFARKNDKITIGWVGNPAVHLENLKILRSSLVNLGTKYDVRFKIVSYLGDSRVKEVFKKVEKFVEIDYGLDHSVAFNELPRLLSDFDIGVSPMMETQRGFPDLWFEGKSTIKTAIYMAMGLPTVVSPVGEQKYVIDHGIDGFIAKGEDEWYIYLSRLIEDAELRKKMEKEARNKAVKELSLEACGSKLLYILEHL